MNQEILDQQEVQKNIREYLTLTERIRHIFTVHQGSSIFLTRLVDSMMKDNLRGNFVS
jgi:hypothetical protein